MSGNSLWKLGLSSLESLETPEGILASGRTELFGCIFGRDSLVSALAFISLHERTGNPYFLALTARILTTLARLQGQVREVESGEEPGKIIHEYRPDKHEHLTKQGARPWFVYPSGEMKSYDSVDATPLFLMLAHRYAAVGDAEVSARLMPSIRRALTWLADSGDHDGDGFIDYLLETERVSGGLAVQSWMDSADSAFFENSDDQPAYPIAPVEVQAYAWAALMLWGDYFVRSDSADDRAEGDRLLARARELKRLFNARFILRHANGRFAGLAFALDGQGRPMTSARSSMGHVLFAAVDIRDGVTDGMRECVLEERYVPLLRSRLMSRDLFVPQAGIRTLSTKSRRFDPLSYHNGSIWPHDTAMLAWGLDNFGYGADARRVRHALLNAFVHFKTPIELFGYRRGFRPYAAACQTQAWSAAALLLTLAVEGEAA